MPTMSPDRVTEVISTWRSGLDDDGLANPAGPMFSSGYTESEITMTGPTHSQLSTFEIISCAIPESFPGECCF